MGLIKDLPTPASHLTGWPWTEETDPAIYAGRTDWPKISIVTPSYQQGDFIEETIRSILLQNYPNLEFIIIDGGSTDSTVNVIKKYEKWIAYWVSEKDDGIYHALNKGLNQSLGKYIQFIGVKDLLAASSLFNIFQGIYDRDIDIIYGNSCLTRGGKSVEVVSPPAKVSLNFLLQKIINHQAVLTKTSLLNELGGFDESFDLVSDWIFLVQAFVRGYRFKKVDTIICNYDLEGASSDVGKTRKERERALNNVLSYLKEDYLAFKELKRYKLSRVHRSLDFLLKHIKRK